MSRYAFVLYEIRKLGDRKIDYHELALIELDTSRFSVSELRMHLRIWALGVLVDLNCDIGLYSAEFSTLDDEGQPDRAVSVEHVAWSGTEELETSTQVL